MSNGVRERIDMLKELNNIESDVELINRIYRFKKLRNEVGGLTDHEYYNNNKGSFSQCFNGQRSFKPEDYLAIEYVLNSSMAYIIEGKGEVPTGFKQGGIRFAAFADTVGNYEELIREDITHGSDEYNKSLIDYMIEYKSKNGFKFFAEKDLLPIGKTGGYNYNINSLLCSRCDKVELLKILCEVLPIELLIKYFDGFLDYNIFIFSNIDDQENTSFTDDVIAVAIKREDLRKELAVSKKINLDSFNRGIRSVDGGSFGEGLFVNYGLTVMIKYALTHDIDDEIRAELIESAIRINQKSFEFVSTFSEEELQINNYGYITDKYDRLFFGSIAMPCEANIELSKESSELLKELNRQVHDYHEFISNHSKISVFANEIFSKKKDNQEYYNFFKLMNDRGIKSIPSFKQTTADKDLFEVPNSEKSRISNGTDADLKEILLAMRKLDDISINELKGKTYYLVDPSIYLLNGEVNYIMPKDVIISNKYSNLVSVINDNFIWDLYETRTKKRVSRFVNLIKIYGINKDELEDFIRDYAAVSEEQAQAVDKTNDRGKDLALRILTNKSWIEIYRDSIIKEF